MILCQKPILISSSVIGRLAATLPKVCGSAEPFILSYMLNSWGALHLVGSRYLPGAGTLAVATPDHAAEAAVRGQSEWHNKTPDRQCSRGMCGRGTRPRAWSSFQMTPRPAALKLLISLVGSVPISMVTGFFIPSFSPRTSFQSSCLSICLQASRIPLQSRIS